MSIYPGCEWLSEVGTGDPVLIKARRAVLTEAVVERVTPTLVIVAGEAYNKSDGQARKDPKGFGHSPRWLDRPAQAAGESRP